MSLRELNMLWLTFLMWASYSEYFWSKRKEKWKKNYWYNNIWPYSIRYLAGLKNKEIGVLNLSPSLKSFKCKDTIEWLVKRERFKFDTIKSFLQRLAIRISIQLSGTYLFKIKNRNTRTSREICSKLTIFDTWP